MPWESIFPIQIVNQTLKSMTNGVTGMIGLLGVCCTLYIFVKDESRITSLLKVMGGISSLLILLLMGIALITPSFDWKDNGVYRNGEDFIVVQEQETFVTTSIVYPRLIRTTSPYSMIRFVEEKYQLKDDVFLKDSALVFKGLTWRRESQQR
ncbi:hypothetical protein ABIB62_003648 [Mucilaginibacter sp. UYP25]